jgi:hypothetical protein
MHYLDQTSPFVLAHCASLHDLHIVGGGEVIINGCLYEVITILAPRIYKGDFDISKT